MKFNLETLKNKTEKNMSFITTDFQTKKDFFYNNAYTIIKSNELFNGTTYIDILQTINSKNQKKKIKVEINENSPSRKKVKSSCDARNHLISENSKKKYLKDKLLSENIQSAHIKTNELTSTFQSIGNKTETQPDRKVYKIKKLIINNHNSTSVIPNLKTLHVKNSKSQNLKTFSYEKSKKENHFNLPNLTEDNRNYFTQTNFSPQNRLDKRNLTNFQTHEHESKSDTNKNNIVNKNHKNITHNNVSSSSKGAKLFLEELYQLKEKYLRKFQKKYLASQKRTHSNMSPKNDSKGTYLNDMKKEEEKNFKQANNIFRKFIGQIVNKYIKEKKIDENIEPDPIAMKLRSLDNLEHSLPDYSKVITKLKQAVTNMEKRKIILNYESLGNNEKLDDVIAMNKSKLSWDFHQIKTDFLPKEFQKKIFRHDDIIEHLKYIYRKNLNNHYEFSSPGKFEKIDLKPKFKSVGKAKILVVPNELKKKKEIYEDQKVIQVKETRNHLEGILSPQITNIKSKRFYDGLAIPKYKSEMRKDTSVEKIIVGDYTRFEKNNLNIVNQIKRIKKKFKKESLYVDPKSAFEGIK